MGGWRFLHRKGKALRCWGGAEEEASRQAPVGMGTWREGIHTCADLLQHVAWRCYTRGLPSQSLLNECLNFHRTYL